MTVTTDQVGQKIETAGATGVVAGTIVAVDDGRVTIAIETAAGTVFHQLKAAHPAILAVHNTH